MSPPDHYELSLRCRRKAEQEIEQNDLLTAAEMMWGAVVHAIKFVAPTDIRDTLHSHRDIKQALPAIDARIPVVNLQRLFGHGEALHRYFYRVHLPEHQVRNNFRQCQRLLGMLLA
jgi:hypothetical protein